MGPPTEKHHADLRRLPLSALVDAMSLTLARDGAQHIPAALDAATLASVETALAALPLSLIHISEPTRH